MAKTLQYWGTGNFQEHPYTGRIVTWTEKEKQTVDDAIATKLLASGAGFVLDNDETGEVVTSRIDPVTGGISLSIGGTERPLRKSVKPFVGVLYETTRGLSNVGTGASFALDATIRQRGRADLKVTTGSGNNAEIELNPCGIVSRNGCFVLRFYVEDYTKVSTLTVYLAKDTSYTNFALFTYNIASIPGLQRNGWHEWRFSDQTATASGEKAFTGGAFTIANQAIHRMKVRVTPVAAQVAVVYLDSLETNPQQQKASILITADDSYKSWYSLGVQYLNTLGLKSTLYSIASSLGTGAGDGEFMSESNVSDMYAAGHDIAVHGATNLTSLSDPGARYADIVSNRDWLINRGMSRAAYHYAWPNGVYEMSTGDRSLRDAAYSAGMLTARGTNRLTSYGSSGFFVNGPDHVIDHDACLFATNIMNLPIIGHDGTQDVGTTQLAALIARIDRAVAEKSTCILIFHKIGSSPVDALHCPEADFQAIANAVYAHVSAGNAECLTVSQWYKKLVAGDEIEFA